MLRVSREVSSMKLNQATAPLFRRTMLLLLIGLAAGPLTLPAAPSGETEAFRCTGEAKPGEVAVVTSSGEEPFYAELSAPSGNVVSSGRSFTVASDEGSPLSVVLLGLPSSLSAGEYSVKVLDAEREREIFRSVLRIGSREFRSEHIPLRASLTELRSSPDPQKRKEALEIQAIYNRVDRSMLHESGKMLMPVEWRRISSRFGDRRVYEYSDGRTARALHTGLDLAADTGTAVKACGAGQVVLAKDRIISGYTVVIAHLPGVYSVYFHLHSLTVEKGDVVSRGQQIGTVGMSGLATGPHLHWEIRVNGVAVDPRELTKKGIVGIIRNAGAQGAP
jgi:murein DD-endopeptidase MepM/ murein hydrolase activator NlpD